jgi:hypothetical protein
MRAMTSHGSVGLRDQYALSTVPMASPAPAVYALSFRTRHVHKVSAF